MGAQPLAVTRGRCLPRVGLRRTRPRSRVVLPRSVELAVQERTVRWAGIAALIWRTLIMLVILLLSLGWTERYPGLIVAAIVVSIANAALLLFVWMQPRPTLLRHPVTVVLDVGLALALNLGTSFLIRHDTLYAGYPWHDLFFPYVWATVALWTGVRGVTTGLVLLVLAAGPLQWAMTTVNRYPFSANLPAIADRDSWALASFLLALAATSLFRRNAEAVALGSHQTAKAQVLRAMHDSAIQALEGIRLKATPSPRPPAELLAEIHDFAQEQAGELRDAYRRQLAVVEEVPTLANGLEELAASMRRQGFVIELLTDELTADPPPRVVTALLEATREALMNAHKHSGTNRVLVRGRTGEDRAVVVIRDHGRGFLTNKPTSGFGLRNSIIDRMEKAGGTAEIWTEPNRGVRITLQVPK
jgi:signal transduction histidine kinase